MGSSSKRLGPVAVALAIGGLASSVCTGTALDANAVVAGLQSRYDATTTFRAAFQQEIESRALGQKLISRGTVYYQRPGRMRWEFAGPERQVVVADGTALWIYQEAQRQVIKIQLEKAFRTATPMSFLIGLGKISVDFEAKLRPADREDRLVVHLRPRASDADVGWLELELAAGTYDILGALVTDAAGGTTRWEFSDLERNVPLGSDLFEFTIPAGVDLVVPVS